MGEMFHMQNLSGNRLRDIVDDNTPSPVDDRALVQDYKQVFVPADFVDHEEFNLTNARKGVDLVVRGQEVEAEIPCLPGATIRTFPSCVHPSSLASAAPPPRR